MNSETEIMTASQNDQVDVGKSYVELDWRLVSDARPLSVTEQIAEHINQDILCDKLPPGQRVSEQSIADRFQVSRGPVREALRLLEREGVIEIIPRKGAHVTLLTVAEVTELFNIRRSLMGLCVQLVAENITEDQFSQIRKWVAQMGKICQEPGVTEEYVSISYGLCLYLFEICGSKRLSGMLRSLARQSIRYSVLSLSSPERRVRSAEIWRGTLKAFQDHDGAAAEKFTRQSVEESRDEAISQLDKAAAAQQVLENEAV